ncbi:metallophosphoesterase [Rhizobium oryzicola]|uniref:Metallophosphoesterase n=1 Tax=Rhizobium oryzicola TaxID=1232668 RepID=A0ABT8SVZ6_9HYPH|nr:metallophosphoesterase [Rhizobium oryzicola]MDO1582053.1 metallophosphoesterase [Rhizobium oryzicola]
MIRRRTLLKLLLGGFMSLVATASYPFVESMGRPRITRYRLTPGHWAPGLKLKICVLADFHACRPWMTPARMRSICGQAQELGADIILLLGDYLPGVKVMTEKLPPEEWVAPLKGLKAPLGVHAVLGNHDYWGDREFQNDPTRESFVARTLSDAGISVYINRAARIEKDGQAFWLAGLGDQLAILPRDRLSRDDVTGIDDLPATLLQVRDDAPVILMAHEPDAFFDVSERIALTLSGHTHGGQFNLFGWRPFTSTDGSKRYPAGLYREKQGDLIVSKGLGCSALPLRIGSWPEILLIELG